MVLNTMIKTVFF